MPKVIQMPRSTQSEEQDEVIHRSMILPDLFEESESLEKIHRWLETADTAPKVSSISKKRTA